MVGRIGCIGLIGCIAGLNGGCWIIVGGAANGLFQFACGTEAKPMLGMAFMPLDETGFQIGGATVVGAGNAFVAAFIGFQSLPPVLILFCC